MCDVHMCIMNITADVYYDIHNTHPVFDIRKTRILYYAVQLLAADVYDVYFECYVYNE